MQNKITDRKKKLMRIIQKLRKPRGCAEIIIMYFQLVQRNKYHNPGSP